MMYKNNNIGATVSKKARHEDKKCIHPINFNHKVQSVQSLSDTQACSLQTDSLLAQVKLLHVSPHSLAGPASMSSAIPHMSSNPLSISDRAGRLESSCTDC